jgi:UDP-N-acetylmuramyl pentapeptide phosphotransferase/UDP-N-acetylglucosamine-1-phosphate transferase
MQGWTAAAAGAALAAAVSALSTWTWIVLARRWRVQDEPGRRRLHEQPTPRGAGVAIAIGWWLATALACSWYADGIVSPLPWLVLVTSAFLSLGLLDDFAGLSARIKGALQALLAVAVFTPLLPDAVRANLPMVAGLCLSFLYFVNAWNFMDGSNGMIAGQSLLIALALATWPGQDAGLAVAAFALAGACAGFLPFNFPRAKVFLGDAGSFLLGSAVFLLLVASCSAGTLDPVQALLLPSVVLLDSGLTLARRVLRGRPFWKAHREHLYQYAVRRGHSHARVALAYSAGTVLAWMLALALERVQSSIIMLSVAVAAWGLGAVAYVMMRRHWLGRRRGMGGQG